MASDGVAVVDKVKIRRHKTRLRRLKLTVEQHRTPAKYGES